MPCIAEAAAAAYAAGTEAFKYNRENYMFDNALRFGRFMAQYQNVQAQVEMYRDDIRDLTAFTVTKQDAYHTVGTIFFVLNFQLIWLGAWVCTGRLRRAGLWASTGQTSALPSCSW